MKDKDQALILAKIAKNEDIYHLPNSKNDSFQLILTAMSRLESQLMTYARFMTPYQCFMK